MNVYTTDSIRNVVLLGHGGCGKTSLVEAMAYVAGLTTRIGKVADGNTISDYDKEEIKRKFSIHTSVVPIEWNKTKINILDTPGFFDFIGEVEEAVAVADAAIIVVSGKAGVEVGTEKAWELCEKYNLPRMIFVDEMDVDNASYRQVVEDLTERYGKKIAPFYMPIRENEKLVGYINVAKKAGRRFTGPNGREECEIPSYSQEYLDNYYDVMMEAVAETSDEFMDRYFDGDEFSLAEIRAAMKTSVHEGSTVPVTMGSNTEVLNIHNLLNDMIELFPTPNEKECKGVNMKTNESFAADYNFATSKSAYVWKTIVDPFMGKYSLIKVCSGVIKSDDVLYNASKGNEEKLSKLYILRGSKPEEVPELHAGDIGAIGKANCSTGDTLSTKAVPVLFCKTEVSVPYYYQAFRAKKKGEEDKIQQALNKIMDEDQTLKTVNDAENHQTLLYGMGDQHLAVVVSVLQEKYKVEVELDTPRVAFRETLRKKADVEYKYKKQSGGHGQYGHVKMIFEPSGDMETPYVFEQSVVGGTVPKNYYPAVEKGIQECVAAGPLAGYPVVGVKANLYDGSYHPVDSSEMAFKTASIQAFKKGFMEASPVLLEPIESLTVIVPNDYTGDVMGDLNKRRGRVLGMNPVSGGKTEIVADVPMMEIFNYNTDLRSMTGGSGTYKYEFARYEQAPADVQEREVANRASEE